MPKGPDDETKLRTNEDEYARGRESRTHQQDYNMSAHYGGGGPNAKGGGCALAILAVAALAILGGIGFGVWYFFFR